VVKNGDGHKIPKLCHRNEVQPRFLYWKQSGGAPAAVLLSHKWTQGILVTLHIQKRKQGSSSVITNRRGNDFSCQQRCCELVMKSTTSNPVPCWNPLAMSFIFIHVTVKWDCKMVMSKTFYLILL